MYRSKFIVCFILLFTSISCSAREKAPVNPFLQFAGKPYGTYHYALRDTLRKRYYGGTEAFAAQTYRQMLEVPDRLHDHQWKIEAGFFRAKFLYRRHKTDSAQFSRQLLSLLAESRKVGNKVFTVRLVRHLFDFHRDLEPISSIPYAMQLEQLLPTVTSEEFPDVIDCKFRLGEFYLKFHEYKRAERYFLETIHHRYQPEIYQIFIHARNDMGVIYRDHYNNLDISDRWFRSIVTFHQQEHVPYKLALYKALRDGSLGENQMLRHRYAQALPFLMSALEAMDRGGDYVFCYELSTDIATCLCYLGRYEQAPRYLTKARQCRSLIGDSVAVSHVPYYVAMSKYYIGKADAPLAGLYQDSAFNERERMRTHFSPNQFFYIERKMVNMQLQSEAEKIAQARRELLISAAVAIISILFLSIYLVLYLKKRAAYRALVERNISWASQESPEATHPLPPSANSPADAEQPDTTAEKDLFEKIRHHIETSRCYLDQEVSLGDIAAGMFVNRTYVSNAINACCKNFNTLINEYRVRCAIRLLTDNRDIPFKELQWQSGFNSRKSFYNAFKNVTGMSPTQFKSNMAKQ